MDNEALINGTAKGRIKFEHNGQLVYEWEQTIDEVHLYLVPPPGTGKVDLHVDIAPRKLSVGLKGVKPFIEDELAGLICRDDSFWMLEDGELHIQLGKMRKGEVWDSVFKTAGHRLDPLTKQAVQKAVMLERFQDEHPRFDFSGAEFSGAAPDPREFMGGVKYD